MDDRILQNINELFDSYDLFSGSGEKRNIERIKRIIPDITELEITELKVYLEEFYKYCSMYGNKLADKYKVPFLPHDKEAENEIREYISMCQVKYPQIDEIHIRELFSTVCWLSNR